MPSFERIILAVAGLYGACGVAALAAATHFATPYLDIVGPFLIVHAAALVGIAALSAAAPDRPRLLAAAGAAIALGTLLFCGDLALRGTMAVRPLPFGAPAGGTLTMLGWLLLALTAATAKRAAR